MRNLRSYYSASIAEFLAQPVHEILGIIHANNPLADTTLQQSNTWEEQIHILKEQLQNFEEGHILLNTPFPVWESV